MTDVADTLTPGWHPDPSGRFEWRYWDGAWTNRVANSVRGDDAEPLAAPASVPAASMAFAAAPASTAVAAPPEPARTPWDLPGPSPAATDAEPVTPFGDATALRTAPSRVPRRRRSPWGAVIAFVRSLADQPESYQSKHAASALPPEARTEHLLVSTPRAYGRAGLVALGVCGVVAGVFLPWLSGNIEYVRFAQTGADLGSPSGYVLGALAAGIAALLAVRIARLRWVTLGVTLAMAGFIARDLLHTFDTMQSMNRSALVEANIGTGLWVMMASVAVAMIAAARLLDAEKSA